MVQLVFVFVVDVSVPQLLLRHAVLEAVGAGLSREDLLELFGGDRLLEMVLQQASESVDVLAQVLGEICLVEVWLLEQGLYGSVGPFILLECLLGPVVTVHGIRAVMGAWRRLRRAERSGHLFHF